jgi:amicyanin
MRRILLAVVFIALMLPIGQAQAATTQVHMSGYAYGPAQLTIKVGDTVKWTNHDKAPHDAVTTAGPAQFRSPMLSEGQNWSFTFTQPGTYSYYCSVHPDMRATIVVQPVQTAQAPPPPQQQTPKRQQPAPQATPPAAQPPAAQPPAAQPPAAQPEPTPETPAAQPVAAAAMPEPKSTLDPLLLVAGLVAGVATLCLLLIGSRPT